MNWQQACERPYYGGADLGANWSPAQTVFKLWAPTASAVEVQLFATGTDGEPGAAALGVHPMEPAGQGVWTAAVPGDLQGTYYLYALTFPDGRHTRTVDPYARAAGANGQRGMVIDLDAAAPEGWQADARPQIPAHARAVWEVHVADFSADEHSGVPEAWRGTYLGFVPEDTTLDGDGVHPTCLNYLKGLGVTHVQLQPIFDYATVDETKPGGYNWGYDPLNYNVPEGSFSTDPCHGEVRVRECRAMVQALHRAGLGVVMDVVYNHTYHTDSWLEHTVPGYWNRSWPDGRVTNGSGCGNDLASERPMVRKYLVDSVVYWAREYHIDGFRFDLMALEDVDTMNAIRAALDDLPGGRDILMYGEPWTGGGTNLEGGARPGRQARPGRPQRPHRLFLRRYPGRRQGQRVRRGQRRVRERRAPVPGTMCCTPWAPGAAGPAGFRPRQAMQVVQYVSAHDNYTLWDKLAAVARRPGYDAAPMPTSWPRTAWRRASA